MGLTSVIYLLTTLFVISFFNLLILRKISDIQCLYKSSMGSMGERLASVESALADMKSSGGYPTPQVDSQVDAKG